MYQQDQVYENDLFNNKVSPASLKDVACQPASVTLSPFSSPDDSDLQYSCEDLNTTFSQTSIDPLLIEELNQPELENTHLPSLNDLLFQFPDLPSFVDHDPENRPYVQSWLESTALQIHYMMVTIAKSSNTVPANVEASPRRMFSALRRLKDRIEIMHQVFQIIENGRVSFGQNPTEAIEPLIKAALEIKRNVSFLSNQSEKIPVITRDSVNLVNPDQVTMNEISDSVMDTYNLMPYNNSSTTAANNLISAPSGQQDFTLFTHIQPDWIHHQTTSLPVTPSLSANNNNMLNPFFSLPASPTCIPQETPSVDGTVGTPCNTVRDSSMSPYHPNSPLNTLSEFNTSDFEMEEDVNIEDDEDYIVSDAAEDEDWKESKKSRQKRASITRKSRGGKRTNVVTKQLGIERQFTRRTATSYDAQTTHYLKSIFFDIYSSRDKLTKDQRRQVQKETGLKPRNITYWFSNHKRRFHNSLLVFKKIIKDSKGSVKNYDDFLEWRRARGLTEEVLENEHLQILKSLDENNITT
ncbi:uncharacterized protein EV154DRAFT_603176 [Mucor mucedo]|uniref:uncharacterized protein n=1 Tax=Mucor mucedo TaxID=29922 RepID=UPI00221E9AD4|nr:uncharacterized protein EV154DRAFT_603176 [Mucor mucedo]KAI7890508.1 hypothetical protein EV154DRAFT_603176 [Mucor mucedo]